MKIIEHIRQAEHKKNPLFSCELVPPPRGSSAQEIIHSVDVLTQLNPAWIDVTSHGSMAHYLEKPDGSIEKRIFKKRPGTLGICGIIQNRFEIDTVAHILCKGFTKEETEDALIELNYLGIHNVLALQGDSPNFTPASQSTQRVNQFASDLVSQITDLRRGQYLNEIAERSPLDFCVGVAGYPEKHFEAANLKSDLEALKKKVQAGADYIITQMFFDNKKYFDYVKACRQLGLSVPIVPGLKVIKSASQIKSLVKSFHIDLPSALVDEVNASPSHAAEIGQRWALKQCEELLNFGVPGLHFYIMNDADLVVHLLSPLFGSKFMAA